MVVKFADTQKEKDQKRIHQATGNLWAGATGIGANMAINNLQPQYLTVIHFPLHCYLPVVIIKSTSLDRIQQLQGLATNGTSNLSQLSGLSALGVQQLLAASQTQNSLASTQGICIGTCHPPALLDTKGSLMMMTATTAAALQSLANLQSHQAGLGLGGNSSPGGSSVNDLNAAAAAAASGLGLAALANFNSQNIFGSLGKHVTPTIRSRSSNGRSVALVVVTL